MVNKKLSKVKFFFQLKTLKKQDSFPPKPLSILVKQNIHALKVFNCVWHKQTSFPLTKLFKSSLKYLLFFATMKYFEIGSEVYNLEKKSKLVGIK